MRLALAEAARCEPTPTAFCVGCVLAYRDPSNSEPAVLSTGYSRELPGNTHAEANALTKLCALTPAEVAARLPSFDPSKASVDDILRQVDVYTTLEPCSIRTSGLAPCADALIAAGVRRCFIGVGEPDDFVQCEGARKLKDAGVEIVWLKGMEEECLSAARRGH
uniref:CMP/dCMP-type deaminase domain-containing protein n=2 Tax=Schizophyllum commune (strain H4-8 / FGSC 9210) TaxID=578458 RepID=D8PTB4_SCHCM